MNLDDDEIKEGQQALPLQAKPSFDIVRHREVARLAIAGSLLLIIALTIAGAFVAWLRYAVPVADLDTVLKIVFAPLVTIFGTAVGFYYGASERSSPGR